ncbi:MAG TPA: hypothetical protein VML55_23820, partial [Planctomycetaceae bacterium]|nr:hypothetical protein [Planctomycetaceae bacterium]
MHHRKLLLFAALVGLFPSTLGAQSEPLRVETPMAPPAWALLQRELLRANTAACEAFFNRYFDERGYLLCVERWGGNDGPDDAIENLLHWPVLHALGAPDSILELYKRGWEGHLRQYTAAKTVEVPFARHGMYYKEFPVMFDWLHHSEGLTVFNLQGLSDPYDRRFRQRARRYAGFYLNEDPGAPNYDPEHKVIRSLFNGSRGPLMRKATALDWAGDPIEIENRFQPRHGERTYQQFLEHFQDYNDIVGDHPSNLVATSLALNAYMLDHAPKYRDWILEYVGAWRERMIDNGHIIPSNIGLDGSIGGETGGKWYGGVYGWGFTVVVPQDGTLAHRNNTHLGFAGFMNAYLLTGDERWLDPWRKQIDTINAQATEIDGRMMYPQMYGDEGWYHYTPEKYSRNALEIYYFSLDRADRGRVPPNPWLDFLEGENPAFPEEALRRDLDRVRRQVEGFQTDSSTPDTRLADDSMRFNPASVASLVEQMMGGLIGGKNTLILHARLRYFDPQRRRAGLPEDVAALVEEMSGDHVTVTLVNVNQVSPRAVTIQAGAYAEHRF